MSPSSASHPHVYRSDVPEPRYCYSGLLTYLFSEKLGLQLTPAEEAQFAAIFKHIRQAADVPSVGATVYSVLSKAGAWADEEVDDEESDENADGETAAAGKDAASDGMYLHVFLSISLCYCESLSLPFVWLHCFSVCSVASCALSSHVISPCFLYMFPLVADAAAGVQAALAQPEILPPTDDAAQGDDGGFVTVSHQKKKPTGGRGGFGGQRGGYSGQQRGGRGGAGPKPSEGTPVRMRAPIPKK